MIKQQYTVLANGSRCCTTVRFMVENSIGMLKRRYKITHKIDSHFVDRFGLLLRFCAGIHVMFQIGKINPTHEREIQLSLLNTFISTWGTKHPITREFFNTKLTESKKWTHVTTAQQLKSLVPQDTLKQFIFSPSELKMKTSNFYLKKAQFYLWHGKDKLKLFVNPIEGGVEFMIKGIPKAMKTGTDTTVLLLDNKNW